MPKRKNILPRADLANKIQLVISYVIRLSLVVAIFFALIGEQWMTAFIATIGIVLTFLPAMIERNYRVYLPGEMEIVMIVFVYASIYLGNIREYYTKFPWWDIMLHSISGMMLGCAGFLVMYVLNTEKRVPLRLQPKFMVLFSFAFAVSMGTLWEIFEFFVDSSLGGNMQHASLKDTMWDLVSDTFGALITSFVGYFYIIKKKVFLLERFIKRFVNQNAEYFEKFRYLKK